MPHTHRATKRQDTGRAAKRKNVGRHPVTGRRRPTLPPQASPRARTAVAKRRTR